MIVRTQSHPIYEIKVTLTTSKHGQVYSKYNQIARISVLGACHEAKYVVQLSSNSVMANNTGDWPISGVINKKAHLKCNHDMGLKLDGSTHQP
ncbi:unnamed protein product [Aspergillus oryzae]|uniref:Unnamed protein product n=2 Tax=Aspergillus oryzae TaxID=5062 RepID=A0AAN4YTL0_ASPOZ|nr:unnamed protein product [Aspergillus oryzae]GMF92139.1 unnamed protein product [Aspergillus oryzae]GMG37118.1 unnamed protein product [Aspergillus oryzae]GMG49029.1 unnamed protein product [Aspergillus oryzae var. brunneus]